MYITLRYYLFLFVFIIQDLIHLTKSQLITLPYEINEVGRTPQIKINIGKPSINYNFNIDIINEYPIIEISVPNPNIPSKGAIIKTEKPEKISDNLKGIFITDTININDIKINDYTYVLVTNKSDSYYSVSSNSFNSYLLLSRSNHSLINLLYSKQLIKKKLFQVSDEKITIGDYSDNTLLSCMIKAKLTLMNNSWSVPFTSMRYGTIFRYIFHEGRIEFNMSEYDIIAPDRYYYTFHEDFFKYDCKEGREGDDKLFYVEKNKINMYKTLEFTIDEKVIILFQIDDLFEDKGNNDQVLFRVRFRKNIPHWIIGFNIMKKFNIVFNEDMQILEFNSQKINIKYLDSKQNYCYRTKFVKIGRTISDALLTFILIFGIIILGINKYKK